MLHIINHHRNTNQNYNETPPYICQKGYHQITQITILVKMWRERNSCNCWWGCKLVQPPWKTVQRFLKKLKIELSYDPAIPLLSGIHKKPQEHYIKKIHAPPPRFTAHYLQLSRQNSNLSVHQQNG